MARQRTPVRRTQAERSAATQARIIAVTMDCLAERGLAQTTMAAIAERAGVTVGAIQHQFGDKDGVLRAVLEHSIAHLAGHLAMAEPAGPSVDDRVDAVIHTLWSDDVSTYQQAQFPALMELLRAMRRDPTTRAEGDAFMRRIALVIHRQWMAMFWDVPAPERYHFAAERLLFASLNGLALEPSISSAVPDVSLELRAIRTAIVGILGAGVAEGGGGPVDVRPSSD